MNKDKLKKQNNLLIYLGIFVTSSLIIASILRILTPEKEKIIESDFVINNYNKTKTTYKKVVFKGKEIKIPETFSLFRPLNNENQAKYLAEKIIKEYQLIEDQNIKNFWGNDNYYLTYQERNNAYSFYDYRENTEEASTSTSLNIDLFSKNCENFIQEFDLNLSAKRQDQDIFFIGDLEGGAENFEETKLIEIPFTQEINEYPVFYQNEKAYPFYCRVDKTGEVKTFIFKDLFKEFEEIKQIESINLDTAVNNISKGKASIVYSESNEAEIFDLSYIQSATLSDVSIEYRYDSDLQILYPFYKFQAKIINLDDINIDAEIITPAVSTAQEK